jgi:tryptophan halogenase
MLGIDEQDFIAHTKATFKLGIEFVNWKEVGHRYMHSFGKPGVDADGISFNHHWLRAIKEGLAQQQDCFNAESEAAFQGRFAWTQASAPKTMPNINYAYQFDAGAYASLLREHAEKHGVVRVEGKVAKVIQANDDSIKAIELEDGRKIEGALFIDCSGFRGLLIEQTLNTGYDDWSHWLPVNRAVTAQSEIQRPITPFTRSTAKDAGWQWRIPLQHRLSNGYVYSSDFLEDNRAQDELLSSLEGAVEGDPRMLKFVTGRRRQSWVGNCVAIGLSSGFLEPLESTGIHLVQSAVSKLLAYFPHKEINPTIVKRFNAEIASLYEDARDFIIAHYKVSQRNDTAFWQYCQNMQIPDSLSEKLELFSSRGEILTENHIIFHETNWFSVLRGQGMIPKDYHPVADVMPAEQLSYRLEHIRKGVKQCVSSMPTHEEFLTLCSKRL